MNSGIYEILNKVNGKKYIGQSKDLATRKSGHFCSLRKNKHPNSYLQKAVNKYGIDNFEFIVIEETDIDNLTNAEQYWIDYYWDSGLLYNLCPIADSNRGYKHSEETKLKLSKAFTGVHKKPLTPEHKSLISNKMQGNKNCVGNRLTEEHKNKCSVNSPNKKPVHQIDMNTNEIIKTWTGVTTAARELGVNKSSILACARGKYTHGHGYKWQYVNN